MQNPKNVGHTPTIRDKIPIHMLPVVTTVIIRYAVELTRKEVVYMKKRLSVIAVILCALAIAIALVTLADPPDPDCVYAGVECAGPQVVCWYQGEWPGWAQQRFAKWDCPSGLYVEQIGFCACVPG
jgi:hypothetical protein